MSKLESTDLTITIGTAHIEPAAVIRDLGVMLDSQLTMKAHISLVSRSCFYQLRRLRTIRRCVDQSTMEKLVQALIISRLDYCNSILAGLPATTIEQLQRVQNAAARLVHNLRLWDHVTPSLMNLHWLPMR
mgnify:FL=1